MKIPKIKKTIKSFLLSEEGKISKESVLKIGAFLAAAAGTVISESENVEAARHASCKMTECCGKHGSDHTSGISETFQHSQCDISVNAPASHANDIKLEVDEGVVVGTHYHAATDHCNQHIKDDN
ncbi:MAG: hypothetical protein KAK00_09060 [Nanoarchaeota archaeon]|nr:hypothetical protein [Nanoarchaeota archaeon]